MDVERGLRIGDAYAHGAVVFHRHHSVREVRRRGVGMIVLEDVEVAPVPIVRQLVHDAALAPVLYAGARLE